MQLFLAFTTLGVLAERKPVMFALLNTHTTVMGPFCTNTGHQVQSQAQEGTPVPHPIAAEMEIRAGQKSPNYINFDAVI